MSSAVKNLWDAGESLDRRAFLNFGASAGLAADRRRSSYCLQGMGLSVARQSAGPECQTGRRVAGIGGILRFALPMLVVSTVFLPAVDARADQSSLWRVLSDNALLGEPAMETGATYTAEPAFTNPADTSGRRLINRDPEGGNWNDVAGINYTDQTVVFDLQATRMVGKVELLFSHPQKPAAVEISLGKEQDGPWTTFGTIAPGERSGWHTVVVEAALSARYVRLFFKLDNWGWYVNEVKIWGLRGDEPGPDAVIASEADTDGNILLTHDGEPRASIVVAATPARKSLAAAADLQDHIYKMSGAVLPIRTDDRPWSGTLILVGPSKCLAQAGIQAPDSPDTEKIILKTIGTNIALVGNDTGSFAGTEFAVQTLLEKLGCGWFTPDPLWQPLPQTRTISVPALNIEHVPAFRHRSVWIGLGKRWYLGGTDLSSGHAHAALFPPSEYFQEHPQYYALIGGKRTAEGEWQLCTSNPDVIRLTVEKARTYFDAHPEMQTFSLGNNDTGGFCECDACVKTGSNPAARMLAFSNAVAKELRTTHAGKSVTNYAYWYTYEAPREQMRAEPGVIFVPVGQGCHAHSMTDSKCAANVAFRANLVRWAGTGTKLGFYEWYIPGCSQQHWRRIPWVAGSTALADQQFLRSQGVEWLTYESQHAYEEKAYPLRWPLFYVAAKGMWDASLTFETIMREACEKLYGAAAPRMLRYFLDLESCMRNCPGHGGIWNLPDPLEVYPADAQARLSKHLAEAQEVAESASPEVQQRIAAEQEIWKLAVEAMDGIRQDANQSAKMSYTVFYNEIAHVIEREKVTGRYLRDRFGILGEQKVILVDGDRDREIGDRDELQVTSGMKFRSNPRN